MKIKVYLLSLFILIIIAIIKINEDYTYEIAKFLIRYIVFYIIWNSVILYYINKYTKQGNIAIILFSAMNFIASAILLFG